MPLCCRAPALAVPSLAVIGLAVCLAACSRHPKSPAAAWQRLSEAVVRGDGKALFDALDQKTRWAWMTVQRSHREAYDVVLSNYPAGPARDREQKRFQAGALSESAADLFAAEVSASAITMLRPMVGGAPRMEEHGEGADAVLSTGGRVPLARGADGSWGFAGLLPDAKDRELRAVHDLELIRQSAADYERAAARSGK